MSRCDNEGVFYRVFCVSLLLIAFTFTVILTNVFIDIDGLLSRKEQESQTIEHAMSSSIVDNTEAPSEKENAVKNYDDEGIYRTKRSLDSTDFLVHNKNSRAKNVLANRLAELLEELDQNESRSDQKAECLKDGNVNSKKEDIDLHTAMHSLLREGIAGHMDLNSVYNKVHMIVRNYQNAERKQHDDAIKHTIKEQFEMTTVTSPTTSSIDAEHTFFEELTKCKKLQKEILDLTMEKKKENIAKANVKSPKFLIKTLINIQNNDKEFEATSAENFNGIIKLIYNGKSLKIKSMDEYESTTESIPIKKETTTTTSNTNEDEIADLLKVNVKNSNFSSILSDYLKKYKKQHDVPGLHNEKRLKRNVKIKNDYQTDKNKEKKDKFDDGELFVEIETHFDNKGIKGKKKEELVKQLIEKIRKAIRSNQEDNKQLKHLHEIHVKKRVQNPLEHKNESHEAILNDNTTPSGSSKYRELYPISKIGEVNDGSPTLSNGDHWIKKETGPKFISPTKSINSAELSQIDVDFNKVMEISGVPQRLQIPLNTDLSGENPNTYFDLGNLKFLIKNLEGSGFSIGLNQYVDHAPDSESVKLFTGIEKLVSHQSNRNRNFLADGLNEGDERPKHEMTKRDFNLKKFESNVVRNEKLHKISRRSVSQNTSYNSKKHIFLNQDNLPYKNHQEIYEDKQNKISFSVYKQKDVHEREMSTEIPEDLEHTLEEKLNATEIFNLVDKKKRAVKYHKFKKLQLNTFIKTNVMTKEGLFTKSKRNRRQIGKIKIIAKDTKGNSESDENIYIISGENMYANRAMFRRLTVPKSSTKEDKPDEKENDPILFEDAKPPVYDVFEESVKRNPLMLKYPHVFLDDINDSFRSKAPTKFEMPTDNEDYSIGKMAKVQDLVNALTPFPKKNYKVTVKLLPKDKNITNAGFREVHTSINKTFNKGGLLYSSLVNVSEISKIESANDTSKLRNDNNDNLYMALRTTPDTLQKQHEALQTIINEQKERINKQLEHLNKQKERLNSFVFNTTYETTTKGKTDILDILLNSNESKALHLRKDDVRKLLCTAVKQQENSTTITVKPDVTTTSKPIMDPLKVKLLKAISNNEHLTSQILNKIDQNSMILQSFLTKITDKIQALPEITRRVIFERERKMEIPQTELYLNNTDPLYVSKLSNATDLPPFTYYQQPKVVDRSYIHSNPVVGENKVNTPNRNLGKVTNYDGKLYTMNNTAKYFVDEDYFRTYGSLVDKLKNNVAIENGLKSDLLKADLQNNASLSLSIPKSMVPENKNENLKQWGMNSNTPSNVTRP